MQYSTFGIIIAFMTKSSRQTIKQIIHMLGNRSVVANLLGITPNAVKKWEIADKLPLSEYIGETSYALTIIEYLKQEKAINIKITDLLPDLAKFQAYLSKLKSAA